MQGSLRALVARFVPAMPALVLLLQNLAYAVHIGGHHGLSHRAIESLLTMGAHQIQAAVIQVVDRGFHRRMLLAHFNECRIGLTSPVGLTEWKMPVAFFRLHAENRCDYGSEWGFMLLGSLQPV